MRQGTPGYLSSDSKSCVIPVVAYRKSSAHFSKQGTLGAATSRTNMSKHYQRGPFMRQGTPGYLSSDSKLCVIPVVAYRKSSAHFSKQGTVGAATHFGPSLNRFVIDTHRCALLVSKSTLYRINNMVFIKPASDLKDRSEVPAMSLH